jgi:hypothetical protein
MARDPKASFKFTTIGSGAGGFTASADKLAGVYAMPATINGLAVISDVWSNFNETIGDALRFGAQGEVPSVSAQALILGGNGQNQFSFIKFITKNTALAGTGLTDYKFQIVGDSQPTVTFAVSANISGTFLQSFVAGTPVQFVSSGVLPPELNPNTVYYVLSGASTSVFTVSATVGGTAIAMTSTGSTGAVHQVVQVGVPAAATTLADRTLKNGVPLTPLVTCPFSANGTCFKFVPILSNNRSMQAQVTFPNVTAAGAGTVAINAIALQNGREGAMGVSF